MQKRGFPFIVAILLVFMLSGAQAISTFPTKTQITEYDKPQTVIITYLNDGPRTEEVRVIPDPLSAYLMEHVTIEPESFRIGPHSRRNIEVRLSFPSQMSPEEHTLILVPYTSSEKGQKTEITFTAPGEARHDLHIESVSVSDISTAESVIIDISLFNRGNVIARAVPTIEISNSSGKIAEVVYQSVFMVMPYSRHNVSIRHDILYPRTGEHEVSIRFSYNSGLLNTPAATAGFHVREEEQEDKKNHSLLIAIMICCIAAGTFYLRMRTRKNLSEPQRLRKLSQRIHGLEKEFSGMVKDTEAFINSSNAWLKKNMGEDYEFR